MSRNPDGAPRARGINYFDVGVVGRRTGITMKANVKKDEDGLDNIDDFWADEDENVDEEVEDYGQENSEHDDGNQSEDRSTYYDQDLPEELLATPTSRRSRAVPMSNSGSRRGLLSSSAYDHGAEEYQSPSFHAVKKRLVFTKEAHDAGGLENNLSDRESSSPALDRLLSVSKHKALLTKAAPSPGLSSKLAQTKGANKPTPSYISKALGLSRPGINKAFNLGSDDKTAENGGLDNSDEEPASRPATSRATKATPQKKRAKSVKTPVEVRRTSKAALPPPPPASPSPPPEPRDDDHEYHEEEEATNNGFTFSDEEDHRLNRKDSDDEEQEQEQEPIDHRKTKNAQSKTQVKETKAPIDTSKAASRANIPKKPTKATATTRKPAAKSTSRAKKISTSDNSDSNDESSDDHSVPTSRKTTTQRSKTTTAPKPGMIEIPVVPEAHEPADGTRKSSRTRLQPLEYWKNEKVILGKSNVQGVAEIKAVIKAPVVEERTLVSTSKRRPTKRPAAKSTIGHVAKKRARGPDSDVDELHVEPIVDGEEEDRMAIEEQGLKEEERQEIDTIDYSTGKTISRVVAESKSALLFRKVQGGGFQYYRGLEDKEHIVSGTMKVLPGGQKPVGSGAKTSIVFYVVSGAAQACVNKTEFAVSTGGCVMVPRGNPYSFTNLSSKRDLILFFVQSKQADAQGSSTSTTSEASTPTLTYTSKGTTMAEAAAAASAAAAAAVAATAKPKPKTKSRSKAAPATRKTRRSSEPTAA
ncbi:MAG: Mif2/CENP-C like-domain-containing protein [Podila humilis]|nr:MAG: Mif2/CENP-C like-domain-containing protein [Podila humilis]